MQRDVCLRNDCVLIGQVDHPVLLTEAPCNPIFSRTRMAELLFETYGVPSLGTLFLPSYFSTISCYFEVDSSFWRFIWQCGLSQWTSVCVQGLAILMNCSVTEFGSDGMFSYAYNQRLGLCESDGLLVCSGHTTTHVIPVSFSLLMHGSSHTDMSVVPLTCMFPRELASWSSLQDSSWTALMLLGRFCMEQMVNGEPIMEACCRTGVGGFHVTSYLKRLLSLQHPYHLYGVCFPSYTLYVNLHKVLPLVSCLFSVTCCRCGIRPKQLKG